MRKVVCSSCGELKALYAKGLCSKCYHRQYDMRYQQENRERRSAYVRRWRAENFDRDRENSRRYYQENRERLLANSKRWAKENPEKLVAKSARRRAREKSLPNTLTSEQLEQILSLKYCFYCGREDAKLTLDHFVPLWAEGNVACGTTKANSVAACGHCNSWKSNRLPHKIIKQLILL